MSPNWKTPEWRSKAYRVWVATFPCIGCGNNSDTAHHQVHPDIDGGKGMGRKADDMWTVPVCDLCHRFFHDHGYLKCFTGRSGAGITQQAVLVRQAELMANWIAGND